MLKRLVITGGTGGLGKSLQERFLAAGWEVLAPSREDLDLTNPDRVNRYFTENPCELLICAAGMVRDKPIARMEESDWDELFAINFKAAKLCATAAISTMKSKGHVIFISSYAALHPAVGQSAYATSKAALMGLTKDLAEVHGSRGIRINTVLPGFMETKMTADVTEQRREIVRESHVLGEFNTPEIVADFIHFLHERMPLTSGQIFQLDSRM